MKWTKEQEATRNRLGGTIIDPWDNIGAAFDRLENALLATAAEDPINEPVLRQVAQGISIFKAMLLNAVD